MATDSSVFGRHKKVSLKHHPDRLKVAPGRELILPSYFVADSRMRDLNDGTQTPSNFRLRMPDISRKDIFSLELIQATIQVPPAGQVGATDPYYVVSITPTGSRQMSGGRTTAEGQPAQGGLATDGALAVIPATPRTTIGADVFVHYQAAENSPFVHYFHPPRDIFELAITIRVHPNLVITYPGAATNMLVFHIVAAN